MDDQEALYLFTTVSRVDISRLREGEVVGGKGGLGTWSARRSSMSTPSLLLLLKLAENGGVGLPVKQGRDPSSRVLL